MNKAPKTIAEMDQSLEREGDAFCLSICDSDMPPEMRQVRYRNGDDGQKALIYWANEVLKRNNIAEGMYHLLRFEYCGYLDDRYSGWFNFELVRVRQRTCSVDPDYSTKLGDMLIHNLAFKQ